MHDLRKTSILLTINELIQGTQVYSSIQRFLYLPKLVHCSTKFIHLPKRVPC